GATKDSDHENPPETEHNSHKTLLDLTLRTLFTPVHDRAPRRRSQGVFGGLVVRIRSVSRWGARHSRGPSAETGSTALRFKVPALPSGRRFFSKITRRQGRRTTEAIKIVPHPKAVTSPRLATPRWRAMPMETNPNMLERDARQTAAPVVLPASAMEP